jgi:hypothetical protein
VPGRNFVALSPVVLAVLLPACGASDQGEGLVEVNQLVSSIERVHTCTELAQDRVHTAMHELQSMMVFDFKTSAVEAYSAFAVAVQESTVQVEDLRQSLEAMKEAAVPVFVEWADDLESFKSMEMRLRSQNRLKETRERYDAVLAAAEMALSAYETFNVRLEDYSTYLARDFNASAVAAVQGEVRELAASVAALDGNFDTCQEAARAYIDAAALPMTALPAIEGTQKPPSPKGKGTTKKPTRKNG